MQLLNVPNAYLEHNPGAADVVLIIVALAGAAAVYLLPSIIGRHRRNAAAIIRLNLFLGWTVVGWFVAMFWTIKTDDDRARK
jgi:hypothetical protein